jgi:molybdenum cofactor synthesis domain-containing protein
MIEYDSGGVQRGQQGGPQTMAETARILIIGEEILSAKVRDENGPLLLRTLRRWGHRVTGLAVLPDDPEVIATAVRDASKAATRVFTTGGVGPTHDDVTMEGIARAFGLPLQEAPEIRAFLDRKGPRLGPSPRDRLALVPQGAVVTDHGEFPHVVVHNVHVMPGPPGMVRRRLSLLEPELSRPRPACAALRTTQREAEIATLLAETEAAFPGLRIGSYPAWGADGPRVLLTVEAEDPRLVEGAVAVLVARLDPARLLGVEAEYRPEDRWS